MRIYRDDRDHQRFLDILGDAATRYELACLAYCLMPNHYHLVVTTRHPNLSAAMRQLNGVYAQWWNRTQGRVGHVVQGRFKAQVVQERRYLLAVCRYVVLNPVRAGLAAGPGDWAWSSFRPTAGLAPAPAFLNPRLLLGELSLDTATPDSGEGGALAATIAKRYVRFVTGTARGPDVQEAIRGDHRVIGENWYVERFKQQAETAPDEVSLSDRLLARPSLGRILRGDLRRSRLAERVRLARVQHGYTMSEIAAHLELPVSTVRRCFGHDTTEARPRTTG